MFRALLEGLLSIPIITIREERKEREERQIKPSTDNVLPGNGINQLKTF